MIQSSTFDFLQQLAENNHREWFLDNKTRYETARDNVVDFTAELIKALTETHTSAAAETDPKKCVMRIYRDIRFSKDKTPYKNNFGIGKLLPGIKSDSLGYYVHIQPGESFAGGGCWMPQANDLKSIRQEIDYNGSGLKEIIDAPKFKKLFGEFRDQEKLKTIPRDYSEAHPDIELIKLKSFVAMHKIENQQLMKPDAAKYVAGILAEIYPLTVFLNNAIG